MGKTYNAVYSVKGGCGKTAFSIFLAKYLTQRQRKVCLVDVDILGSSMLNTFIPVSSSKDKKEDIEKFFSDYRFINDIVQMDKLGDYSKFLISSEDLEKQQGIKIKETTIQDDTAKNVKDEFYVVLSSIDAEKIDKYRTNSGNDFVPNISHNIFKSSFKAFINNEVCFDEIKDIVFDMPPNADGFSSTVFDCIFGKEDKKFKIGSNDGTEDRRNLFMIMNVDSGHIITTMREIKSLTVKTEMEIPTNLFIIINDMFESPDFKNVADGIRIKLSEELREIKFAENEYHSIWFIYFPYNRNYFDAVAGAESLGIARKGIQNVFDFDHIAIFDLDGNVILNDTTKKTCGSGDKDLYSIIVGDEKNK